MFAADCSVCRRIAVARPTLKCVLRKSFVSLLSFHDSNIQKKIRLLDILAILQTIDWTRSESDERSASVWYQRGTKDWPMLLTKREPSFEHHVRSVQQESNSGEFRFQFLFDETFKGKCHDRNWGITTRSSIGQRKG